MRTFAGWGEGGQYGPAEPMAACIESVLARYVIGQDQLDRGRIWHDLYSATRDFGQKGSYIEGISALDIALWDIAGQALGQPVSRLLGGISRERGLLCHGLLLPRRQVSGGSGGAGVRAFGGRQPRVQHAHGVRMGRGLETNDVRWFEEPVTPEDYSGYRELRSALSIPVAGGECDYTRYGFRELIGGGYVDIAQPDICVAGGFSEWLKILALAESFGVPVIPHVWGSGVALAGDRVRPEL